MKALNNLKFVSKATVSMNEWFEGINTAETFEKAKEKAAAALGYIDCMTTYLNCMIDKENNGFTAELDTLLDAWAAKVYGKLAMRAVETNQPTEYITKLLKKRDWYSED